MSKNETKVETPIQQKASAIQDQMTTAVVPISKPSDFKALKRITRDVSTMTRLGEAIVMLQSELFTIKMKSTFPPHEERDVWAVQVLDCLRGEEYTLILGAVLASTFKQEPQPLTGKYYAIRNGEIPPGKRYRKPEVILLERSA